MAIASRVIVAGALAAVLSACITEPDYSGRLCSELDPCPTGWRCTAAGVCADEAADPADAGEPDATVVDGGPADAAPLDAGAPDAAPDDVGAPDAQGMDAGAPDAVAADAGPADAGDPRQARCNDPIGYPGQGWQARFFDLPNLPDPSFGTCLGVDDVMGAGLDVFYGISDGPAPGVIDFGSIWTSRRTFDEGVYTFIFDHDDGIRVYVDNQLVHEDWNHGRETGISFQTQYITAGVHQIRIEHFDDDGEARLRFSAERGCTRLTAPQTGWLVSYHGLTTTDDIIEELCYGVETLAELDVDHGLSAPAPVAAQGVDDDFVTIARTERVMGGLTRFNTLFDDGMRLFVGSTPLIDVWEDGTTRSRQASLHVVGAREIRVEKYDERDQNRLRVTFDTVCNLPPASTAGVWFATYYPIDYDPTVPSWTLDRGNCLGAQVLNTNTLEWGTIPGVVSAAGYTSLWGAEYFGNRTFGSSTTINVTHDDGLRVFSGSSLFYESWTAPQVITSQFTLPPGNHDLRLEYFENQGGEQLRVTW